MLNGLVRSHPRSADVAAWPWAQTLQRALQNERFALLAVLLLTASGLLVRLGSVVVSDMDEGTYIYAGKLVSEGWVPYRDFLLTHPPLIALFTGAVVWLFGSDIMTVRYAYMSVVLVSMVPLYAMTRSLAGSSIPGLLSIVVYTSGMVLLANMGRTVRLEPLMNAFLIAAFACYVLYPRTARMRFIVGVLLALAVLVKLVAVIPAALLVLGDLAYARPVRRTVQSWLPTALGAALVLLPAFAVLLSQPGFVDDVLRVQIERPEMTLLHRLHYLTQNFMRFPVLPVTLVAAVWLLLRGQDIRLRVIACVALGSTGLLVLAFKTFYGYYVVQVLPWIAIVFSVVAWGLARQVFGERVRPLMLAGALVLAGGVPALYGEIYHRFANAHTSSPAQVVALLRGGTGYVYSMYPSFALQSRRELYPWYYVADSLVGRIAGRLGDADFAHAFSECQALVLWQNELAYYPRARDYVEHHFSVAYQDAHYTLWVRSGSEPRLAEADLRSAVPPPDDLITAPVADRAWVPREDVASSP